MTLVLSELPGWGAVGADKAKILLHGYPGSGKTTLAASIAELGKTLYTYFPGEQGLASIPASVRKNIVPVKITSVEDMHDLLLQLQTETHDYTAVVIEGVNTWQDMYTRHVQSLPEAGPRTKKQREAQKGKHVDMRRVGGDSGSFLKDDLTFWYSLADSDRDHPIHVVMTSQSKRREVREKDGADANEIGRLIETYIGPDVFPSLANTCESRPDYVGYCYVEDQGLGEDEFTHCVRFGPHDQIRTKIREDVERGQKWPAVVGQDGKRLTLPKFLKFLKIE